MNHHSSTQMEIGELWLALGRDIDVFICCGSYEQRCRSIADAINPKRIKKAIVAQNINLAQIVSKNSSYLQKRFGSSCIPAPMDTCSPIKTADGLINAFTKIRSKNPQRYLVDITTFTHESLLILFRILTINIKPEDKLFLVYTSAADYSVNDKDKSKWLSKGVEEVRSVLGYPGEILPSRLTHLIVLVGYEYERASRLIEVFEPYDISLGYGAPGTATAPKHQKANQHFHRLLKTSQSLYRNIRDFSFSCCDPWDAKRAILECAEAQSDRNIYIAPMNTKISTIGAALAAIENGAIRLCYAQAKLYNFKYYSIPGNMCHLFEMHDLEMLGKIPNKVVVTKRKAK